MIALCLPVLRPGAVERLLPIGTSSASSAWVTGWNHVARQILRLDPGWPSDVGRGLELARQLAMLTYRAEPSLDARQHRAPAGRAEPPVDARPSRATSSTRARSSGGASTRGPTCSSSRRWTPTTSTRRPPGTPGEPLGAFALCVDIDTDQLFTPAQVDLLADWLDGARRRGAPGHRAEPARARRLPHRVGRAGPAGPPGPREHPMSPWQVYKFGGSSLGTPGRLPVVLRRVAEAERPLALVVSALGDTTEWLLEAGRAAAAGDEVAGARRRSTRALALARSRGRRGARPRRARRGWSGPGREIVVEGAARALALLRCARARVPAALDLLLSVGERLSSRARGRGAPVAGTARAGGGRSGGLPDRRPARGRHRGSGREPRARCWSGARTGRGQHPGGDRLHRPGAATAPRPPWAGTAPTTPPPPWPPCSARPR